MSRPDQAVVFLMTYDTMGLGSSNGGRLLELPAVRMVPEAWK